MQVDCVVSVLISTPGGIPVLIDRHKPSPHFWKLIGGRNTQGETPEKCAARKVFTKTRIQLNLSQLRIIHEELRGNHKAVFFAVQLEETPKLIRRHFKGELVQYFLPEQFSQIENFFPPHQIIVAQYLNDVHLVK